MGFQRAGHNQATEHSHTHTLCLVNHVSQTSRVGGTKYCPLATAPMVDIFRPH